MAKKKKNNNSNKKKTHHIKKKYSLKTLKEMLQEIEAKAEAGVVLSDYDEKMRSAIEYTVDFVMNYKNLDLTIDSERYLHNALAAKGVNMLEEGMEEEEIIKTLSEMAASYFLFEQINFLSSSRVVADIYYNTEESDNLMIKANLFLNPNKVVFDPFKAMERVSDTCFEFVDVKPSQFGVKCDDPDEVVRSVRINLDAYKNLFISECVEPL